MFIVTIVLGLALSRTAWARRANISPPRWPALVVVAAVGQALSGSAPPSARPALIVATVGMGALWAAKQRRSVPGALIAVGTAANVVVMAVNGGMPVSADALRRAGFEVVDVSDGYLFEHVAYGPETRLGWLADVIPVPVLNVVSVGDLALAAGIALWVAAVAAPSAAGPSVAGAVDVGEGQDPAEVVVARP